MNTGFILLRSYLLTLTVININEYLKKNYQIIVNNIFWIFHVLELIWINEFWKFSIKIPVWISNVWMSSYQSLN